MAYNIVKHRRGTTQEWAEFDLIPEAGELVIEECSNGTLKCKIGTGTEPFSKLPYIDDDTKNFLLKRLTKVENTFNEKLLELAEVQDNKLFESISDLDTKLTSNTSEEISKVTIKVENLEKDIKELDESVLNLVQPSIGSLDTKYSKKLDEIVTQHESDIESVSKAIEAKAAQLSTTFNSLLENQAVESAANLKSKAAALTTDYTAVISDSKKELQDQIDAINSTHSTDLSTVRAELIKKADELVSSTNRKISDSETRTNTSISNLRTELENSLAQLNEAIAQLRTQSGNNSANSGVSIPNDLASQLTNLQTKVEQLDSNDTKLLNLLYEAKANVDRLTTALDEAKKQHSIIADSTNDVIEALDNRLSKANADLTDLATDKFSEIDTAILRLDNQDIILLNLIYEMKSKLENQISNLQTVFESELEDSSSALTDKLNTEKALLEDRITKTGNELINSLNSAKKELDTSVKNFRENLDIKINTNKKAIDQINSAVKDNFTQTTNKIAEVETAVAANQAEINLNKNNIRQVTTNVDNQVQIINTDLNTLDKRIDAQASRISNIIAGSPTEKTELSDIRAGYDGQTYESAGDAVRAIGDNLTKLKNSLSQYIDTQAIDGLYYDTIGEVGLKQPHMLYLTADHNVLTDSGVHIISGAGGGSGGSTTGSLKINYITTSPVITTKNIKTLLKFTFSGVDPSGDAILQASATWRVNNTIVEHGIVKDGDNEFDITKYLSVGINKVLLTVTDDSGSVATKSWNVQQIELSVSSNFDDKSTYPVDEEILFTYIPYGSVEKTAVFILDGNELDRVTLSADLSGTEVRYRLPKQSHGSHVLEFYLEAILNDKPISSNHELVNILVYDPSNELPVIGVETPTLKVKQYSTVNIVYTVYDPSAEEPTVDIKLNNEIVSTVQLKANPKYHNTPTGVYSYTASEEGTHILQIVCKDQIKTITVIVEKLYINIPTLDINPVFDFNPAGRSNNDIVNRLWSHNDIHMTVSPNFDWTNGGYIIDGSEGPCFCIKAGSTATIDYKLFADDAKKLGKEFKLVFKTRNVADPEATFLSCVDNTTNRDHIGIKMNVHNAYIYGQSKNLELSYSEEDVIEFEFNISKDTEKVPMVMGYEDGVPSRPMVYNATHSFTQHNPQEITLGSPDCDILIYRFKVYNTSLTSTEILNNFIIDARTTDEMISRYTRNQIYDKENNNKLTPEALAEKCPWLRVYKLSAPHFTNSKDDKVADTTIQQLYKNGDPILDNWTCYGAQHSGQGTSSNNYGASGRNLDFIMNKDTSYFELGDGSTTDKITLTRESVPVAYLNAKVNIASSNNLTNALLAKRYNEFNPYRRPFVARDGVNTDFIKDTMEFHNCVVFIQETDPNLTTHREFADTDWHFYAIGNIGDSKKTDNTRLTDPNDKYECCVEIMDIELPLSDFPTDTMIDAMGYKEDETTHEKTYTWAKNENLGILYEREYTLTSDTEINLNKVYYIDTPKKVTAAASDLTVENLTNLYERLYTLTEDLEVTDSKVYYLGANGTVATKEYLQNISNPKDAGLYEWKRLYQKTADTEIIEGKPYYVEVMEKTNAMAYTFQEVRDYLWAKNENLGILYERNDNGDYVITDDSEIDLSKVYYVKTELKDEDDNIVSTDYFDAMGYTTRQVKVYTYARPENLDKLYEVTYRLTPDTTIDLTNTYYVDILEHDDFSEDYTYGWRYISNKKDSEVVDYCKQKWIEFYRFVTRSTDAEFKEHFEDYFVKDSALYYYLFTTRYCMVDNRAKNTFWHYGKTDELDASGNPVRKWDLCWDYDNDTSLGLNNYGKQVYRYGLEDTDRDEKGEEVFREMDSTFFRRVRDCFTGELKDMYQALTERNAWHAESFITECDSWQSEFPEELWRLDIDRKYIRTYTTSFINGEGNDQFLTDMANGKMKYHRRQWERSQAQYMASKYQTTDASGENAVLRCAVPVGELAVQPSYRLKLTPYAYMYLNVQYGTNSPIQVKATPNEVFEIPFTGAGADIVSIYSASLIQDFGDLSACYVTTADTAKALRIRNLILGNGTSGYTNPGFTTLTTGSNPLLEELNVENVTGLDQALDLSKLINLRKLYAFGTNIPSALFANNGKLAYVELPAINNISLKNLSYLSSDNFKLSAYTNVVDIDIEGCPLIDQVELFNKCNNLVRARLIGVNFGTVTYEYFSTKVFKLKGLSATGGETPNATLVGTARFEHLTGAQFNELRARYPQLTITYNHLESTITFKDPDIEEPLRLVTSTNAADCLDPVYYGDLEDSEELPEGMIAMPIKGSNAEFDYIFLGWSTDENIIILTEDLTDNLIYKYRVESLKKVEGDRTLYPVFEARKRSYIITFINPTAQEGSQVLAEIVTLYGSDANYREAGYPEPVKLDTASPESYAFTGWYPPPEAITGDLTCEAQFTPKDQNRLPGGEDDGDILPGYTIGWLDISDCVDSNGNVYDGYVLNHANNTMSITKCNNTFNTIMRVPETLTLSGSNFVITGLGGFSNNINLEQIDLPDTLLTLASEAFTKCSRLKEITLPANVWSIGKEAFMSCTSLQKVEIPATVSTIGEAAFAECVSLTDIQIDQDNSTFMVVEDCLINKQTKILMCGLATAKIPQNGIVQGLSPRCFYGMPITTVQIPANITIIPSNAFANCSSLQQVDLPEKVKVLEATCFAWCTKLSDIELPNSLETISSYAFNSCPVSELIIPASVTTIGGRAFGDNKKLTVVTFERSQANGEIVIPDISYIAFANSGTTDEPITFNIPWTREQHRKFVGTYIDNKVERDKDIFFGACVGSRLRFIDENGEEVDCIIKTEEVHKDV
jgi:hypothetical protein